MQVCILFWVRKTARLESKDNRGSITQRIKKSVPLIIRSANNHNDSVMTASLNHISITLAKQFCIVNILS